VCETARCSTSGGFPFRAPGVVGSRWICTRRRCKRNQDSCFNCSCCTCGFRHTSWHQLPEPSPDCSCAAGCWGCMCSNNRIGRGQIPGSRFATSRSSGCQMHSNHCNHSNSSSCRHPRKHLPVLVTTALSRAIGRRMVMLIQLRMIAKGRKLATATTEDALGIFISSAN